MTPGHQKVLNIFILIKCVISHKPRTTQEQRARDGRDQQSII